MILGYIVNSKWHTKYQSLYLIDNTDFSIHYVKENDKILECENLYTLNNGSYFLYNILIFTVIDYKKIFFQFFLYPLLSALSDL